MRNFRHARRGPLMSLPAGRGAGHAAYCGAVQGAVAGAGRSVVRTAVCGALRGAVIAGLLLAPVPLLAQTTPPPEAASAASQQTGRIVGTVYDSLARIPIQAASVWIPGLTLSTTTDKSGRFTLDKVPTGRQVVAFSSPPLDSAGLGSLGAAVEVEPGKDAHVALGPPSLRTLWRLMCPFNSAAGSDSGIVFGTVRDGETMARLVKAPTQFTWYDIDPRDKKLNFAQSETRAVTDSSGTFYGCGLPSDVSFQIRAFGNDAASGLIEYALGPRKVTRIDLTVSRELRNLENTRGSATVRGVVRDLNGAPVDNATVTVVGADTSVRTNATGAFVMQRLPAGTQSLQVRKIGLGIANQLVDLLPNANTEVQVVMPAARTLATYNVRATKKVSMEEADFNERRKLGMGIVIDMEKRTFPTAPDAVSNVPRVTLKYGRGGSPPTVTMLNGKNECTPGIYLDGVPVDIDLMTTYPTDNIRYVEVFNSGYFLPARFIKNAVNPCGAILYWTKTRW